MKKSFCHYLLTAALLLAANLVAAEPIRLDTPSGALYGTLEMPRSSSYPLPVALLIAGSGPTDRNGNTTSIAGANNSLRYLAEGLAAQGIASLRYDKRGIAQSAKAGGKESDLRFETLIDDAGLWIKRLRHDKRFSSLVVIGHSEGSLIGMIAARKTWADGFVSIAGIGRPAGQVILSQLGPQLPSELLKQAEEIVMSLNQGQTIELTPPALDALFRPSVQGYLISWFRYDPAREIKKLSIPVLIVQGTTDIQVSVSDANLLAEANPKAQLLVLEGMNHVLKAVPDEREKQLASYVDPTLPVVPELISNISQFVKSVK